MFQSDPIERRFGWYSQLSTGIYYISVRHILEAEKKIRILSLVKFSGMTTSEIKALLDEDLVKVELILTNWQPDDLQELTSEGESNAFYFVAGYIGFPLKKTISCTACQELMVIRDKPPDSITIDIPSNQHVVLKEFINIMSRRGLSTPSDLLYLSCLYAHSMFSYITATPEEKDSLLGTPNPKALFAPTFIDKMQDSLNSDIIAVVEVNCEEVSFYSKNFICFV
ncbi:uncharacterized protein [Lepeophtheirus salmonis]|uniref:uncharacterized protein n=1 Tax=Lepeophtheirus salmonis TaxID=72036 RepID=UPI001AE11AC1|nr:uncharacterized protein LOC121128660 [Lepeophtheirus salmonis]